MILTRELAQRISEKFNEVSLAFGQAQKNTGLRCPTDCGKCCLKPDISCAPIELLPLAYSLYDAGVGGDVLEKARNHSANHCVFLEVTNAALGNGRCREYEHRPYICRAFGLAARKGKNGETDYSLCQVLRSKLNGDQNLDLIEFEIPFIDLWKKQLESIDFAFLEKEIPINEALVYMLEKILLIESYRAL
jgi:Fe-S-cluster containining protein